MATAARQQKQQQQQQQLHKQRVRLVVRASSTLAVLATFVDNEIWAKASHTHTHTHTQTIHTVVCKPSECEGTAQVQVGRQARCQFMNQYSDHVSHSHTHTHSNSHTHSHSFVRSVRLSLCPTINTQSKRHSSSNCSEYSAHSVWRTALGRQIKHILKAAFKCSLKFTQKLKIENKKNKIKLF